MFILTLLGAILMRPSVIIFLVLLALGAAFLVWRGGLDLLIRWACDARVWLAVAGFCTILAVSDLSKANKDLKQRVDNAELSIDAKDDNAEVLDARATYRASRQAQTNRIRDRITHAEPAQQVDAALDEIAAIQDEARPPEPDDRSLLDRVLDREPDGVVAP